VMTASAIAYSARSCPDSSRPNFFSTFNTSLLLSGGSPRGQFFHSVRPTRSRPGPATTRWHTSSVHHASKEDAASRRVRARAQAHAPSPPGCDPFPRRIHAAPPPTRPVVARPSAADRGASAQGERPRIAARAQGMTRRPRGTPMVSGRGRCARRARCATRRAIRVPRMRTDRGRARRRRKGDEPSAS
jgi:hypothetical protein